MAKLLNVKDLATQFASPGGVVKAVDGISFDLDEAEILGIVGESGCGKSVSALSIMRLIADPPGRIVDGEVVFDGQDLLKLSDSDMRRIRGNRIAMIFQEPMTSLNPVLSIGRQMTETLELHLKMAPSQATERARELLEMVGISDSDTRLKEYPHQLSGGMRQRVMIAMAISCNPRLIIADEPTTALDVTIQAQILELMQSLSRDLGTALIIITHNLGVVARYAARVLVMYAGKIVETGTAREIYHNPRHPYTLGLLRSVPRLDEPDRARLDPIEGSPPDLSDLPQGCSFAPRCTLAIDRCVIESPPLMDVEGTHGSACWRLDELPGIAGWEVKSARSLEVRDYAGSDAEGVRLFEAGDYDEAVKVLSEAIEMGPDVPDAYGHRAEAYRKLGRRPEAGADDQKEKALLEVAEQRRARAVEAEEQLSERRREQADVRQAELAKKKRKSIQLTVIGLLSILGGIVAIVVSYANAVPGETYALWWVAIVFGGVELIRGLIGLSKGS
jgi:oligopeptide/dipeptide ABC transporter ATP-binding protein